MSFKKFLTSKKFFKHLSFAVALIGLLLLITMLSLKMYTRHGQSHPVPDFTGLSSAEAQSVAAQQKLRLTIIDSVYSNVAAPGSIVEQVPRAGTGVKQNRTIFITINSTQKERVVLPKLTDISFRQAQVLVENSGLLVGQITYKPSEYHSLVLNVMQDSVELMPGERVLKGSRLDFVIGSDPENEQTPLPDLLGLSLEEAKEILIDAMLNPGVVLYDEEFILTAEDSINAVVWKQRPDVNTSNKVKLGASVDLWITVDEEKISALEEPEI